MMVTGTGTGAVVDVVVGSFVPEFAEAGIAINAYMDWSFRHKGNYGSDDFLPGGAAEKPHIRDEKTQYHV